jgi:hypothetical protein
VRIARRPRIAHLYGQAWVHGAYELYAGKYAAIQSSSERESLRAYSLLAQKGVLALDALQSHEVPFYIRVDPGENGFAVAREVPERLTFTADMSDADRQSAQAKWEKAREHIQTDYEEIRRLDWALTTLLSQLKRVRAAIEHGKLEEYGIVRQLAALAGGEAPPFELPFQVSAADYSGILSLLLERLDDDAKRLSRVESDIVTVGLTARATDAGSASLAANLHKVLLAVISDAGGTSPRPAAFPQDGEDRAKYLARGKELYESIRQTPGYVSWEKHERTKAFDRVGQLLTLIDAMTGLRASAVYQQALDIWRGDADYLSYLKTLAKMVPGGSAIAKVANDAIELTEKARKVASQVQSGVAVASAAVDTAAKIAGGQSPDARSVAMLAKDGGLLNVGSDFARSKLGKQLAFFKDRKDLDEVKNLLGSSDLMKSALPSDYY